MWIIPSPFYQQNSLKHHHRKSSVDIRSHEVIWFININASIFTTLKVNPKATLLLLYFCFIIFVLWLMWISISQSCCLGWKKTCGMNLFSIFLLSGLSAKLKDEQRSMSFALFEAEPWWQNYFLQEMCSLDVSSWSTGYGYKYSNCKMKRLLYGRARIKCYFCVMHPMAWNVRNYCCQR